MSHPNVSLSTSSWPLQFRVKSATKDFPARSSGLSATVLMYCECEDDGGLSLDIHGFTAPASPVSVSWLRASQIANVAAPKSSSHRVPAQRREFDFLSFCH